MSHWKEKWEEAEPSYIVWCSENVEWLTVDPALLREAETAMDDIIKY